MTKRVIKCNKCGYEWEYSGKKLEMIEQGKRVFVTCPTCRTNVKIN